MTPYKILKGQMSKPIALKDLIQKQFQNLKPETADDLGQIQTHWQSLLGENIAENAKPLYIRSGILHVRVNGSAWHCELQLLKASILGRIHQTCPLTRPLADIRFVLA